MGWNDEEAKEESDWLRFMSQYKYDDYRGYLVGARFIESLAIWLQQFKAGYERRTAYKYIKENLIYIGPAEIQRLVGRFFHEEVKKTLRAEVAGRLKKEEREKTLRAKVAEWLKKKVAENLPEYMAWSEEESIDEFKHEVRRTLFMGLSDGARLDSFRRANSEVISNEQVVITTEISKRKWGDLLKELSDASKDKGEDKEKQKSEGKLKKFAEIIKRKWKDLIKKKQKFERVYLVDDFTASGTTFIRIKKNENGEKEELKGKLKKFAEALEKAEKDLGEKPFVDKFQVLVHHYIASFQAKENIEKLCHDPWVKQKLEKMGVHNVQFSYGMILPKDIKLDRPDKARKREYLKDEEKEFEDLCDHYYDHNIYTKHFEKGRVPDGKFGYAECGLPLILYHNTPNNSLSLLWAEAEGKGKWKNKKGKWEKNRPMKPLFRRRQRHTE